MTHRHPDGIRAGNSPVGALKGRLGLPPEVQKGDLEIGKRLAARCLSNVRQPQLLLKAVAETPDAMDHLEAALSKVSPILDPFSFGAIIRCLETCILDGFEFPELSQRAVDILGKAIKSDPIPRWRSDLFKRIVELQRRLRSRITYIQLSLDYNKPELLKTDEERNRATEEIAYLRSVLSQIKSILI